MGNLGGLCGFPFTGLTGLNAMLQHAPDTEEVMIVYGPHVGLNENGTLGYVDRTEMSNETTCCGSMMAAINEADNCTISEKFKQNFTSSISEEEAEFDDFQQMHINKLMLSILRSKENKSTNKELHLLYISTLMMQKIENQLIRLLNKSV